MITLYLFHYDGIILLNTSLANYLSILVAKIFPYANYINSSMFYLTAFNNLEATVISLSKNLNKGSLIESAVLSKGVILMGSMALNFSTFSRRSYSHYT